MKHYETEELLKYEIAPLLERLGFELIELACVHTGGGLLLKILADRFDGGITIDECSRLNKEIGLMLDEKNILSEHYTLEISSPGIDRPLKTLQDFRRALNRKVKFFLAEPVEGKIEWDGVVKSADESGVYVEIEGKNFSFPLGIINKAKQLF